MAESQSAPRWARWILIVAVIAAALLLIGPLGYRTGLLPLRIGLLLPVVGLLIAALDGLAGLIALPFIFKPQWKAARVPALHGLGVSLLVVAVVGMQLAGATAAPPIHDISTDLDDPPQFVDIVALRAPGDNDLTFDREALGEATRKAYPWVQPIITDLDVADALARARQVAQELGWDIVGEDPGGRLEATDTTFWYGFKDDIVVRVRPHGGGARVDLRSASRLGVSDLGLNARRIGTFIEHFQR